jgi:arginyl-tRNA synthetase
MHIAKCLWAMLKLPEFDPASVRDKEIHAKVEFLGKAYAAGSTRFEADDAVKAEIGVINKQIYAKDPAIYDIYKETRQWSLDYFAGIYARVGSHYDRLYFESETYEAGKKTVLEGVSKGIFEESDGAVIFPGEKYGLHTRVFITKEGNATYEGKDMGLAPLQHKEYHPDLIMHVLGPEQYSYTRVIFKALDLLFPETAHRQFHKTYGWVKLKHGKMSSRTGQVVLGEWLLDEAKTSIYEILKQSKSNYSKEDQENIAEHCAIAAVKYAFLRVSTDQEIAFDIKESVSFDGDSGPYLMYSYARCKSVLRKAEEKSLVSGITADSAMNAEEKSLARALFFFPEIVADAARELSPNILCKYLFELAQAYNLFYQKNPILTAEASSLTLRLMLTTAVSQVLQNGLSLLGIATVERM